VGATLAGLCRRPRASTSFRNYFLGRYPYLDQLTAVGLDDLSELELRYPDVTFVRADGRELPFPDRSFDVVHSNAVVEHVGAREEQQRFLAELVRVSRSGFVTTPNRWFPIQTYCRRFRCSTGFPADRSQTRETPRCAGPPLVAAGRARVPSAVPAYARARSAPNEDPRMATNARRCISRRVDSGPEIYGRPRSGRRSAAASHSAAA
jgi:hypothetical protein